MTPHRCFLALLLVAAVLWKIKQKYDMYRRRQRLLVEMEQMASRAFSQVLVEIERRDVLSDTERNDLDACNGQKKKKVCEINYFIIHFIVGDSAIPLDVALQKRYFTGIKKTKYLFINLTPISYTLM